MATPARKSLGPPALLIPFLEKTKHSQFFTVQVGESSKLRFGFHGIFGILALVTTSWFLLAPSHSALIAAVFFSGGLVNLAFPLLARAPSATVIIPGALVGRHQDGFELCIHIIQYINARCMEPYLNIWCYKAVAVAAWIRIHLFLIHGGHEDPKKLNTWLCVYPLNVLAGFDLYLMLVDDNPLSLHFLLSMQLRVLVVNFLYSVSFRAKSDFYRRVMYFICVSVLFAAVFASIPEMLRTLVYPNF